MNKGSKSRSRGRDGHDEDQDTNRQSNKNTPNNRRGIKQALHEQNDLQKPMGEFHDVNPEEWKNIPIPLVHAMKAAINEIGKLHKFTQQEAKKLAILDRKEEDHNTTIVRDLFSVHEKSMKDLKYRDNMANARFNELETGFEDKLTKSIEDSESKLSQLLEDKVEEMGKDGRKFT